MALSLPKAKTIKIKATGSDFQGGSETIEITTHVGTMIPTLTVPSILQLIRNTSVSAAQSMKQNTRYVAEVKAGEKVLVSEADGKTGNWTLDPRTMSAEDLEVMVAQFTPQMKGAKYKSVEWDTETETIQDALGRKMASFMSVRRTRKSFKAVKDMVDAAKAVQAKVEVVDATAKTFAKGGHVHVEDITTAAAAYKVFASAISNFQRIGTDTAQVTINKQYAHTEGIPKTDMFFFMSPEFEALILGHPGVFASDSGLALFKQAGIKSILGVQGVSHISLDQNTNFILMTTGMNGTYGYEEIDGAEKGIIVTDPDWSFGKRLDLKDTYTSGVVLPFQIFVSENT